jgi:probable rRNA maturation factor
VIVVVVADQFRDLLNDQVLCAAAETALQFSGVDDSPSLSIRITDDTEIQELNNRYRGIDKVTDVLSFVDDFDDPDLGSRYLGDIVISYPRAEEQANNRDHQTVEEIQLLIIHGVLHLLGYDHGEKANKSQMWSLQKLILDQLGLEINVEDQQDP